jgi:hypothetical protein
MITTAHILAAAAVPASLGPAGGVGAAGLSLTGIALIGGLALAMHHKKKSPRIIGWLCFVVGISLADLFAGLLGIVAGLSLFTLPVIALLTGFVAFVFLHDGFKGKGGKGGAHRWLQPIFGLILPALLLTLGGSAGNLISHALSAVEGGAGTVVQNTTGQ